MWFETIQKPNENLIKNLRFIPIKVLEMWECRKCLNIIYSNKYTFSPLVKQVDLFADQWSLQNVIIKIEENSQPKHNSNKPNKQPFTIMNGINIYCKVCDQILLGEFKPLIDLKRTEFKYEFQCCDENVKKTKIVMGKTNVSEISHKKSKILQKSYSIDNLKVLKSICQQINQYVAIWYYSKNFKIYQPFISESKKMRQYLMSCKGFMMKTKSIKQKSQKQGIRFRFKQSSCSNNSAELTI